MTINETQNTPPSKPDLVTTSWLIGCTPAALHPYIFLLRLDRPIGTWLLLLPGWWGLALGSVANPNLIQAIILAFLFAAGAVVMRGAGCIINDLWDRDLDARVARTATRPLVAGTITATRARALVVFLFGLGAVVLSQMNVGAILVGLAAIPFIVVYPLMKRITWWPQLFLGLTFNFGVLIGYAAMTGGIGLSAVFLYIAGIFWTLGYDTIYAHMDSVDDEKIGVKSSARALGAHSPAAIAGFYAAATLLIFMALFVGAASLVVLPGIVVIGVAFAWQVRRLNIDDPAMCLRLFRFNRDQGLIILGVIILCVISR